MADERAFWAANADAETRDALRAEVGLHGG